MPRQVGIGGDCNLDGRKTMHDLTRYRPFMVVFSVWFMLVCGCVGDPSLLLSTDAGGSQPVAWQRVDYRQASPARLRSTALEPGSPFTLFVGDESFDVVIEEVYEDDFGITLDVASEEQTQRIRLAVTESSSIAFAYVLDDSQLVEEPNAAPIALIYRNDEGVFITLDLLPDEQQLVMPKRSTAAMITGGEVCAAALAAAPVVVPLLVIGGVVYVWIDTLCTPSYDCTTPWKRFINWCR